MPTFDPLQPVSSMQNLCSGRMESLEFSLWVSPCGEEVRRVLPLPPDSAPPVPSTVCLEATSSGRTDVAL